MVFDVFYDDVQVVGLKKLKQAGKAAKDARRAPNWVSACPIFASREACG